jgi:hypothetical protein
MTSSSIRRRSVLFSRRTLGTLAVALFGNLACHALAIENAETETLSTDKPGAHSSPRSADGSVIEVPAEPIVIEGEPIAPEPTLDQLMQKFREALSQPPSYVVSERQLAGGLMEIRTRFGRFCVRPVPPQVQSGLGGDISLAAPCASF